MQRTLIASTLALCGCGARTELGGHKTDASSPDATNDASIDAPSDATAPACSQGFLQLAATAAQPDEIVIDRGFVYFHDQAGISRVPVTGGAPELLAPQTTSFFPRLDWFALDPWPQTTWLFFGAGSSDDSVVRVDATTSAQTNLNATFLLAGFAVDLSQQTLYAWSAQGATTTVGVASLSGGVFKPLEDLPSPNQIVADGVGAFAATNGGVYALANGGVVLSGLAASNIVASDGILYFTTIDQTNGSSVMGIEEVGGKAFKLASVAGAFGLAADTDHVYVASSLSRTILRLTKKSPGQTTVMQVDPFAPVGIAVDDTCVYAAATSTTDLQAPGAIFGAPK